MLLDKKTCNLLILQMVCRVALHMYALRKINKDQKFVYAPEVIDAEKLPSFKLKDFEIFHECRSVFEKAYGVLVDMRVSSPVIIYKGGEKCFTGYAKFICDLEAFSGVVTQSAIENLEQKVLDDLVEVYFDLACGYTIHGPKGRCDLLPQTHEAFDCPTRWLPDIRLLQTHGFVELKSDKYTWTHKTAQIMRNLRLWTHDFVGLGSYYEYELAKDGERVWRSMPNVLKRKLKRTDYIYKKTLIAQNIMDHFDFETYKWSKRKVTTSNIDIEKKIMLADYILYEYLLRGR